MATLIEKLDAGRLSSNGEVWSLDNGLKVIIFYETECEILIQSESGDVAEQVFHYIEKLEMFQGAKLIPTSCYCIRIDKKYLSKFIAEVEKIDVKKLKPGKSY
ncbi:MAG: hypothetical protein AB7V32_06085 [Candidatus Berkiella sp.]